MPRPAAVAGGAAVAVGRRAWRSALSLPDSALLVRLVRGRAWIIVLGVLLTGIVALNVALLSLNSSITKNAERIHLLGRENSRLRADVSRLSSIKRVQKAAGARGMVMPQPAQISYLQPYPRPTASERLKATAAAGFGG